MDINMMKGKGKGFGFGGYGPFQQKGKGGAVIGSAYFSLVPRAERRGVRGVPQKNEERERELVKKTKSNRIVRVLPQWYRCEVANT